jgi:hypothetical protein
MWVAANHSAPALLHRVDPRHGLSDADYYAIAQWLNTGSSPESNPTTVTKMDTVDINSVQS